MTFSERILLRELVNATESAFTLGGSSLIRLRDLPRAPTGGHSAEQRSAGGEFLNRQFHG